MMSRFQTTTVMFALAALGAGLSLEGPFRNMVLGLMAAVYLVIFILGVSVLKFNFFVKAVYRGDATQKRVTLTFDDGPDPATTPDLLKVLKLHNIRAAFFPIGRKARDYPEIIQQIDREGHVLGNHSFRHAWWTNFLFSKSLEREITMAQEAIQAAIGKVPAYFRPPMGLTNPHLRRALKKHLLTVVGWDVRPFDARSSKEKTLERVFKKIRNGSIVVLHDNGGVPADPARLTSDLVSEIRARNYAFAGLEELTGVKAYQTMEAVSNRPILTASLQARTASATERGRCRLLGFFLEKLASAEFVKNTENEPETLDAFKTRPSPRFLYGISLILVSYMLGWPMVALFSFLSAWFRNPALLIAGPVFYGFSHLVWLLGMFLAGRDSIRYVKILIRWGLRKAAERNAATKPGDPAAIP